MEKSNIVKAFSVILGVVLASILLSVKAYAAIICVDPFDVDCHSTIQDGVDAAENGDTVEVASGTYIEQVTLKDGVTVQGQNSDTTFVWNNNDTFVGVNVSNTAISGFTITSADGDAIFFSATGHNRTFYINIENNKIIDSNTGIRFVIPFVYGGTARISGNIWNNIIVDNNIGIVLRYHDGDNSGGCEPNIVNNVIFGNIGSGINTLDESSSVNSSPLISNNIIMLNGNYGITNTEMTPTVAFNDAYNNTIGDYNGVTIGPGSISVDPEFVDAANENFHLLPTSPAIDSGNSTNAPEDDIDGDSRPQGDGYDMGADEYSYEAPPEIVIKANGKNGPVVVSPNDNVKITVSLDPKSMQDVNCDWWVAGLTTFGTYWLNPSLNWVKSDNPISVVQAPLSDLSTTSLLNTPLPVGVYTFFFIVDNSPDGDFNLTSGGFWGDYLNLFSIADSTQSDDIGDLDSIFQGTTAEIFEK